MAHNSKRNRRDTTIQDGDEYVYPTAKVRETKTRDRRLGKNQIRKGLVDFENSSFDDFDGGEANDDWYDDTPMASDEDIAKELEPELTLEDNYDDDVFFEYYDHDY